MDLLWNLRVMACTKVSQDLLRESKNRVSIKGWFFLRQLKFSSHKIFYKVISLACVILSGLIFQQKVYSISESYSSFCSFSFPLVLYMFYCLSTVWQKFIYNLNFCRESGWAHSSCLELRPVLNDVLSIISSWMKHVERKYCKMDLKVTLSMIKKTLFNFFQFLRFQGPQQRYLIIYYARIVY